MPYRNNPHMNSREIHHWVRGFSDVGLARRLQRISTIPGLQLGTKAILREAARRLMGEYQ